MRLPSPGLTFLHGAEATGMPTLLLKQWILRLNKTRMALLILDVKLDLWMWMSEELSHWPTWPLESKMLKGGDVRYRNQHTTLGSFGCCASISMLKKKGVRPVGNYRPHPITMATTWQQKSDRYSQENFQFWARTTWMESYNNILFLEDEELVDILGWAEGTV